MSEEKWAIITVADGGMGTEITRAVAEAGYHIIMACYRPSKAEPIRQRLVNETGNANMEVMAVDLSSMASTASFADRIVERHLPVSLLMNNAGTMETDESLQVAKRLLALGAHALVLSGGFVSKAPMYVMRGAMPIRSRAYYMDCWWLKYGVRMFGKWMIPTVPFREAYFLEDALKFRAALPEAPLIYVGGLVSREKIDEVLDAGFDAVQMARALLNEPEFVNRMRREEQARCNCGHSNYCIGRMYTIEMACHQHLKEKLPPCLQREIEKLEKQ